MTTTKLEVGKLLAAQGDHLRALPAFDALDSREARSLALVSAYESGDAQQVDRVMQDILRRDPPSTIVAALSANICFQLERADPYPLAPEAHRLVRAYRVDPGLIRRLASLAFDAALDWQPAGQSIVGGYQSVNSLKTLNHALHDEFAHELDHHLSDYLSLYLSSGSGVGIHRARTAYLLDTWFTCLPPGGYHSAHVHPQGWISGVLYLQLPAEISQQTPNSIEFGPFNLGLSERRTVFAHHVERPEVGKLLLFPSHLAHRTPPNFSPGLRRVLSFDVCRSDLYWQRSA